MCKDFNRRSTAKLLSMVLCERMVRLTDCDVRAAARPLAPDSMACSNYRLCERKEGCPSLSLSQPSCYRSIVLIQHMFIFGTDLSTPLGPYVPYGTQLWKEVDRFYLIGHQGMSGLFCCCCRRRRRRHRHATRRCPFELEVLCAVVAERYALRWRLPVGIPVEELATSGSPTAVRWMFCGGTKLGENHAVHAVLVCEGLAHRGSDLGLRGLLG